MMLAGGAAMVYHLMSDEDVTRIMRHPQVAFASDSGLLAFGDGVPHPRGYGNNARVLGEYVRARHVIRLEEAIRKMTSLPAEHFRFQNRGAIKVGYAADVVVFDRFASRGHGVLRASARLSNGRRLRAGQRHSVVDGGNQTNARPGQVLARSLIERKSSTDAELWTNRHD